MGHASDEGLDLQSMALTRHPHFLGAGGTTPLVRPLSLQQRQLHCPVIMWEARGLFGRWGSLAVTASLLFSSESAAPKIKAITQESINGRIIHSQVKEIQKCA